MRATKGGGAGCGCDKRGSSRPRGSGARGRRWGAGCELHRPGSLLGSNHGGECGSTHQPGGGGRRSVTLGWGEAGVGRGAEGGEWDPSPSRVRTLQAGEEHPAEGNARGPANRRGWLSHPMLLSAGGGVREGAGGWGESVPPSAGEGWRCLLPETRPFPERRGELSLQDPQ